MACTEKIAARQGLPYTRHSCSLYQCIALRSRRWLWQRYRGSFTLVLPVIQMDAAPYGSTTLHCSLLRRFLYNFVSDLSSSRIAASSISVPVICFLSWRKILCYRERAFSYFVHCLFSYAVFPP